MLRLLCVGCLYLMYGCMSVMVLLETAAELREAIRARGEERKEEQKEERKKEKEERPWKQKKKREK